MPNHINRSKNTGRQMENRNPLLYRPAECPQIGALRRHIGGITESSLTKQLRELESDGFINRYDFKEVPPHVEYTLTDLGESFMSVLEVIKQWGDLHLK